MANKRKGQLTSWGDWNKHLRKIGKRFYWKRERLEEKEQLDSEITEINNEY